MRAHQSRKRPCLTTAGAEEVAGQGVIQALRTMRCDSGARQTLWAAEGMVGLPVSCRLGCGEAKSPFGVLDFRVSPKTTARFEKDNVPFHCRLRVNCIDLTRLRPEQQGRGDCSPGPTGILRDLDRVFKGRNFIGEAVREDRRHFQNVRCPMTKILSCVKGRSHLPHC